MLEHSAFDKLNKKAVALFDSAAAERGQGAMFSRSPAEVEQDIESATAQAATQWQEGLRSAANNPQAKEPSMATPAVLRMLGAKAAKLVLPKTYLRAIMDKHGDVPASVFENLPALLSDPLFIIPHKDGGLRVFVEAHTAKGEPIAVGVSVDAGGRIHTVTPFNDDGDKGAGMRRRAYQVVQAANRGGRIYARNNEALELARASAEASPGLIPLQRGSISRASVITRADVVKRISQSSKPGDPHFSFAGERAATADTDSNARNVATQMLVDGLKEKWSRVPEIIVARNMQDPQIPQAVRDYDAELKSQGSDGEARGFIYRGKVYLLSDQLKGPQQIAETLFHEVLGHYGLRGVFGEGLTPILQQIGLMRRKDVLAKAREYGMVSKSLSDADAWAAMSAKDRLSAAEEVLAEMAQTQPTIGFVKRAIALVRNWLRANVPGFKSLRLTDSDIIAGYIIPARGFVTRSNETPQQSIERAMLAFSRTAGDQTQTEAFKKWFGDSKVVDAEGNPLVVYHGTGGDFTVFDRSKSRRGNLGDGFYFTPDPNEAGAFAGKSTFNKDGGNLIAAYISLKNPAIVRGAYTGAELAGHDGIIQIGDSGEIKTIVAFRPEQIKSAIGNNGNFDPNDGRINFSRTGDDGETTAFEPLDNQSTAQALNDTLVRYGLGQDWSDAYAAVKLPDALSGVRQALQTAFGRDVRAVAPTADKFNIFNGVYIPSRPNDVYVNVAADVGFVNIAGHELWHAIKRQRPDLIDWYREHSRQFYKDLPAYRAHIARPQNAPLRRHRCSAWPRHGVDDGVSFLL